MERLSNIGHIPREHMSDPDAKTGTYTIQVGDAAGCEKIYVNIDVVKPGAASAKYHAHSRQEEFFLILEGSGTLRLNGEELPVKAGDVLAKPAGRDIAHQFINNSDGVLRILDVGTREAGDTATYPDDNVVLLRDKRWAFSITDKLSEWTSDPNE
jgi:uncharacterized cupin superfamily protein